ncbi:MAG: c-type cytochrome [Sulfurimonas sp.]|jgi:cytochrome c553|nr:c-type cytochrome [Sulfurimonas sp.]
MKKIILCALLVSVSLVAADSQVARGAVVFEKKCSLCHGEKGQKTALKDSVPIAGMEAGKLARILRAYQAGNIDIDGELSKRDSIIMEHQTLELSWDDVDAVAKYVHSLK